MLTLYRAMLKQEDIFVQGNFIGKGHCRLSERLDRLEELSAQT